MPAQTQLLRNFFFTLFCLSLFSFSAQSQIGLGVYGGIESSKFSGETPDNVSFGSKTGFNLGIRFDLPLTEDVVLSFQPGYSQNGSSVTEKVEVESSYSWFTQTVKNTIEIDNQFISLPILVNIKMSRLFYATSGLAVDYLLSSEAIQENDSEDFKPFLVDGQISAVFGFGVNIPIKTTKLGIQLDYWQGLTRLSKETAEDGTELPRVRLSKYRLVLYWTLSVGGKE